MRDLIKEAGVENEGKKVLILGSGGTSKTARALAKDLGASEVLRVSRSAKDGAISYEEASGDHGDAGVIINTTPVGMFPDQEKSPVDLDCFRNLSGLIDAIYNPLRTRLVIEAQKRHIACQGGLYMLVAQAVYASELFTGASYDRHLIKEVYQRLLAGERNIVLTGMPHCGKTTIGRILAEKLRRKLVDTDQLIVEKTGRAIPDIIGNDGEEYFRNVESEVIRQLEKEKDLVIATGGGAVLREENTDSLKKNGIIIFLDRPAGQLKPSQDRPLSDTEDKLKALYETRYPIYMKSSDIRVVNDKKAEDAAAGIMDRLGKS